MSIGLGWAPASAGVEIYMITYGSIVIFTSYAVIMAVLGSHYVPRSLFCFPLFIEYAT